MRCEDFPCCGHGSEGCVDTSRTIKCADCKQTYHPDSMTEKYCYRCQFTSDDYEIELER